MNALIEKLNKLIKTYSDNRLTTDIELLQNLRDELSLCKYYLSDVYGEVRVQVDRDEYIKKVTAAQIAENLKGDKDPKTGKPLNREQISDRITLSIKKETDDYLQSKKNSLALQIKIESITDILNSIASRIQTLKR